MLARHTKHMNFLIQVWLSIENSQSESRQIVQCGFWQQFSGIQIHHVLRGFSKRNRNEWLQNWVDDMHNLLIASEKKIKTDIIWSHLILWYHIDSWKVRGSSVFSEYLKKLHGALYFLRNFFKKNLMKINQLVWFSNWLMRILCCALYIIIGIKSFSRFWRNYQNCRIKTQLILMGWNKNKSLNFELLNWKLVICEWAILWIVNCFYQTFKNLFFSALTMNQWFLQNLEKDFIPTIIHTTVFKNQPGRSRLNVWLNDFSLIDKNSILSIYRGSILGNP